LEISENDDDDDFVKVSVDSVEDYDDVEAQIMNNL